MDDEFLSKSIDDPSLTKAQRKKIRRLAKKTEKKKLAPMMGIKKWGKFLVVIVVTIVVLGTLFWWASNQKTFPPTSSLNHTEGVPGKHISKKPFAYNTQVHMLEHADGVQGGPPGVFINYNCNEFDCEDELIGNLTKIAQDFPKFVYLAPYPNMGAKLVLTKEGQQEVLDSFDEDKIRNFIR